MKYIHKLIASATFILTASVCYAQRTETWSGTIGNRTYNATGTVLVELKGDVVIEGTITVDNATTLRILNKKAGGPGRAVTISNGVSEWRNTPMFKVIGGAKLSFNYIDTEDDVDELNTKYNRIIIDGGAGFGEMTGIGTSEKWTLSGTTDKRFKVSMIQSIAALELFLVDIRNYYGPDHFDPNDANGDGDPYTGIGAIGLAPPGLTDASGAAYTQANRQNYRYTRIKDCVIEKCKSRTGPAISVGSAGDYLNTSLDPNDKDRLVTLENVTIRNCVAFCDKDGWGGIIRCRGGSIHSFIFKNCIFTENFSHGDGGGLWWNALGHPDTKCTIDGCSFINNRAIRNAGAIRLETSFEFTGSPTTVSGNSCLGKTRVSAPDRYDYDANNKGNGGGIHIYGYSGSATVGGSGNTITYSLPSCLKVENNSAYGYGGGIAFDFTLQTTMASGTHIVSDFNGVNVADNTAGIGGGGLYFNNTTATQKGYQFTVSLNAGSVTGNNAPSGGGIFVKGIDINSTENDGTLNINNNKASKGSGGGIFLEDGNISLNHVTISKNSAEDSGNTSIHGGGGLYVKGGSFSIQSGTFTENTSDMYGGGVLVNNTSTTQKVITLTGGSIRSNNSLYGGGISVNGNLRLTISNISLENNTARNGGGIFANGNSNGRSTIVYNSGLIRNNTASKTNDLTTAYNKNYTEVSGLGGGIYLAPYTELSFNNQTQFGIYGNLAENGGDDLFGHNSNVIVTLPSVSSLKLDDYHEAMVHKLFWAEDYITDDHYYNMGTFIKGYSWNDDRTNQRYRNVRDNIVDGKIYTLNTVGTYSNKYLSLTLGWSTGVITLTKEGMKEGENAIFKIYRVNNGTETEYMTVLLSEKDRNAQNLLSREIILEDIGTWKIVETGWSWAYDANAQAITRELNEQSTENDRIFHFSNTEKEDNPIHAEDIVVNVM